MLLIKLKYLWYLLDNSNTGASVYMLNSCLKLNFSVWHLVDVTSVTWWIGFCRGGGFWNFSRYNTAFTLFFFVWQRYWQLKGNTGFTYEYTFCQYLKWKATSGKEYLIMFFGKTYTHFNSVCYLNFETPPQFIIWPIQLV